jgi:hypothetical protein
MESIKDDVLCMLKKLELDVTVYCCNSTSFKACGTLLRLRPIIAERIRNENLWLYEPIDKAQMFINMINYGVEPDWNKIGIKDLQTLLIMANRYEIETVCNILEAKILSRGKTIPDLVNIINIFAGTKMGQIAAEKFANMFFIGGLEISEMIDYERDISSSGAHVILKELLKHQGMLLSLAKKKTES